MLTIFQNPNLSIIFEETQQEMHNYIIGFGKYKGERLTDMTSRHQRGYCKWFLKTIEDKPKGELYWAFKEYVDYIKSLEDEGQRLITSKKIIISRYTSLVDTYIIAKCYRQETEIRETLKKWRAQLWRDRERDIPKGTMTLGEITTIRDTIQGWDFEEYGMITRENLGESLLKGNWESFREEAYKYNLHAQTLLRQKKKKLIKNNN